MLNGRVDGDGMTSEVWQSQREGASFPPGLDDVANTLVPSQDSSGSIYRAPTAAKIDILGPVQCFSRNP